MTSYSPGTNVGNNGVIGSIDVVLVSFVVGSEGDVDLGAVLLVAPVAATACLFSVAAAGNAAVADAAVEVE